MSNLPDLDPEQQLDLARQLFDELTPETFPRAVALTEAAAASGFPDAIAQLATIEAVGAGRPQNFQNAFALLRRAAELGVDDADRQLELLGSDGGFAVPEKRALSDSPRIRMIDGFASAAICDWIVERSRQKLGPAMIWDQDNATGKLDPARTNSAVELRLGDMDVVQAVLRARISIATRLPEPIFETPQVMRYTAGQEFKLHHDYLDPDLPGHALDIERRGQRIGTFLVYLNDDFEGGETDFPRAGITFRGRKGDALFFANVAKDGEPDPRSIHAGKPPAAGEKWIFSQWIRDRAPAMPGSPS
jgi:hypothetical protein